MGRAAGARRDASAPGKAPTFPARASMLIVLFTALNACHKAHRTTADGLPMSDKAGVTGDGIPVDRTVR